MRKRGLLRPEKGILYGYLTPLLTIILFAVLIGVTIFSVLYRNKTNEKNSIADDINHLAQIFDRIDQASTITGFRHQKNPIDFLTIKKDGFVGSEVGAMSLAHPEKWDGPYAQRNPSVEGVEYQVVKTKKGYFITPGEGVKLPGGHAIGKDIIFDEDADIQAMIYDSKVLFVDDRPLAAPLSISMSDASCGIPEELAQAQEMWMNDNRATVASALR